MGNLSRVAGPAVLALFLLTTLVGGQVDIIRNPVSIQTSPGDVRFALTATLQDPQEGLILTEQLPHSWEVLDASPPVGKVAGDERKWLFFQRGGVPNVSISYTLRIPPEASGTYTLSGSWEAVAPSGLQTSGATESSTLFVAGGGSGSGGGGGGGGASTSTPSAANQAPTTLPPLCAPNLRICQGNSTLQCSPDGRRWDLLERCPYGCSSGACLPAPAGVEATPPPFLPFLPSLPVTGQVIQEQGWWIGGVVALVVAALLAVRVRKGRKKTTSPAPAAEPFRYRFEPEKKDATPTGTSSSSG